MNKLLRIGMYRLRIVHPVPQNPADRIFLGHDAERVVLQIHIIGCKKHTAQAADNILPLPLCLLVGRLPELFPGNIPSQDIDLAAVFLIAEKDMCLNPGDRLPLHPVLIHHFLTVVCSFGPLS